MGLFFVEKMTSVFVLYNLLWDLITTEKVYHFSNGTAYPYLILLFYLRPNSPTKKDDTIEVHLNQDDVQVTLTDEHGNPLPLKDVDLQLNLPAKCKDTSFKGFQGVILHQTQQGV